MAKGYLIDAQNKNIREVEYHSLAEMRELIGGHIELAHMHNTGDVLYVDEEALIKETPYYFWYAHRTDQPLFGNGLLVGREIEGEEYPEGYTTLPPKMSLLQLTVRVRFA